MRATVVSVGKVKRGSVLVTAITSPSTVLEVDNNAADFSPEGGQVTIGAHTLTYTSVKYRDYPPDGVTVGTLVLSGAAGFSAPKWTRVDVYPARVVWVAQVQTATGVMSAIVDHPLRNDKAFTPTGVSDGAEVEIEPRDGEWYVTHLYDRDPEIPAVTALATQVDTNTDDISDLQIAFAGLGSGTLAYIDGGLNGSEPFAFVDGGLYS